jgi:hypothetical protein
MVGLVPIGGVEERFFSLLFRENRDVESSFRILKDEGIDVTKKDLVEFKKKTMMKIVESNRDEYLSDYVLDSFGKIKVEFQDLLNETKALLQEYKGSDQPEIVLGAIKELRGQLEVSLNHQSKVAESLMAAIQEKNESKKDSSQDLVKRVMEIRESWFENMSVTLTPDNKLVFNHPSSELIDAYKKWCFQKALETGNVVDVDEPAHL